MFENKLFDRAAVAARCPYDLLIARLEEAFRTAPTPPPRSILPFDEGETLLIMPAFGARYFGVKLVTAYDENIRRNLPNIQGVYCIFDRATGRPAAIADAAELTARRTAAVSALASKYMSRADSDVLCIAGAGNLAPYFIDAHCAVRPIKTVHVWGRDFERTAARAAEIAASRNVIVRAVKTIREGASQADIVTTLTSSRAPFLFSGDLKSGAHLDLVGAHNPQMGEADASCFQGARIIADTREGALAEAGDLIRAIAAGVIGVGSIAGDLPALLRNPSLGRAGPAERTIFKSVGVATSDLAAAELLMADAG